VEHPAKGLLSFCSLLVSTDCAAPASHGWLRATPVPHGETIMASRKLVLSLAAIIFLLVAAGALYRLMVGFPITIGGVAIGQVGTFFALVIGAGLALMLFSEARK
jgi:hypothetical protein